MSRSCCSPSNCCRRHSVHNEPLLLPPYTQVHQQGAFVLQSHERQQQTEAKITKLVENQEKKRANEHVHTKSLFKRTYVDVMTRRLSALTSRDRSRRPSPSSSIPTVMETDLDKVIKEASTKIGSGLPVPPSEKYTPKHGRASMEGRLLKFANLMKGYRFRWVVLNDEEGTLQYYESKERKKFPPKGCMQLASATLSTKTGEVTFTVRSLNGEAFKLKAYDTREKEIWVDRIHGAIEYHTQKSAAPHKSTTLRAMRSMCQVSQCINTPNKPNIENRAKRVVFPASYIGAKQHFREADDYFKHLDSKIQELPTSGMYMNSLDTDLLLLKAMSAATLQGVQDCICLLQLASVQLDQCTSPKSSVVVRTSHSVRPTILDASLWSLPNPADEVPDVGIFEDKEMDKMEDHRTIIVHLLSQLRLGMDLTKVVLPTFVLEKRSLLELFTDCMGHPDTFVKIPSIADAENRFLAVMEWYLLSFHSGGFGSSAKKPYNPIIGETFHCSWHVPGPQPHPNDILMTYTAEQVSHHPPVTAFYVECPEKKIKMNSSIYTKSKFMGMSMGVSLIGKVLLHLANHNEDYVFTLPSAYARSILTVPWVELGDKIQLTCEKTGYAATITFHTKPYIGGKLHHVTAEAKNQKTGKVICKVVGEWNATFQFTYPGSDQESKTIDVNTLKVYLKYVRPLDKQRDYESRKLWLNVTEALSKKDMQKATEYKMNLESIQRDEEQRRRELRVEYESKKCKWSVVIQDFARQLRH